jgi:hypothetical protein
MPPKPPSILLVSGPSGGGKSTFIDQLKLGSLPSDMTSFLPTGISEWPIIEMNDLMKGDLSLEMIRQVLDTSAGCIAHYDIVMAPRLGTTYQQDPAIAFLSETPLIGEIFVRPAPDELVRQFERRRTALESRKSASSRFWRKSIKQPLKDLSAKLRNKRTETTQRLYLTGGWLEACYGKWEECARNLPASCWITVTPGESLAGAPSFRIVSDTPTRRNSHD